jgi:hypothetical protein
MILSFYRFICIFAFEWFYKINEGKRLGFCTWQGESHIETRIMAGRMWPLFLFFLMLRSHYLSFQLSKEIYSEKPTSVLTEWIFGSKAVLKGNYPLSPIPTHFFPFSSFTDIWNVLKLNRARLAPTAWDCDHCHVSLLFFNSQYLSFWCKAHMKVVENMLI